MWETLALIGSGLVQKHVFTRVPNRSIPFVNGALGIGAFYFFGPEAGNLSSALTAGALASAAATGIYEPIKIFASWVGSKVNL